ncbi:MAG: selenide, water dikinase SelD, partial [Bacteroidota bacterium]
MTPITDIIYLDYNATTPIDPQVVEAMKPYLETYFGNPSSSHDFGIVAKKAVGKARQQVAGFLSCNPDEVIFTSGGTESNNLAIKGAAFALKAKGNHIITSAVEHPAVTEVFHYLEKVGFITTYLPVNEFGMIDPEQLKLAITPQTVLVSLMHANNEVGTIQPLVEVSKICREKGILLHTDAAQSCGKIEVNVDKLGVDLLSVAGHKIYGPKGIGVLYVRRGVRLEKLMHGADHEMNLRAGTENVMQIVGLGMACEIASGFWPLAAGFKEPAASSQQPGAILKDVLTLKLQLYDGILSTIPEVKLNGPPDLCLPNTLSLSFPGIEADRLLNEMHGIAASPGAACHSDRTDVSAVLTAMGVPMKYAIGTIRFSLGRFTTEEEIVKAMPIIANAYHKLKGSQQFAVGSRQSASNIKLTEYTHSLGCACKIRPQLLQDILKDIPLSTHPDVLVDQRTHDDAAVYRLDADKAIVQTVDLIPPVVDDPYSFGAISAANSLSDIYAMGGKPLFALSIVAFPDKLLPLEVLKEIIRGATDKVTEAGISIIGGHTIEDTEPKFGLVVTGIVNPNRILTNSGAKLGDVIILTKPIGTGILSTGVKRGLVDSTIEKGMVDLMIQLNMKAALVMDQFHVHACTDVTGFGLLGHLKEMVEGSGLSAELFKSKIPILKGVYELAAANVIPGGTKSNLESVSGTVKWDESVSEMEKFILADAQTSGGLLIVIQEESAEALLNELKSAGVEDTEMIGRFTA